MSISELVRSVARDCEQQVEGQHILVTPYRSRSDKTWGLTDCISFMVMRQRNLTDAVIGDRHFIQVGSRSLMLNAQ